MFVYKKSISYTGYGKASIFFLFICGTILMAVLNETLGAMFIMPSSQCDLQMTPGNKGLLSGITYLGMYIFHINFTSFHNSNNTFLIY